MFISIGGFIFNVADIRYIKRKYTDDREVVQVTTNDGNRHSVDTTIEKIQTLLAGVTKIAYYG